jgi:hypothetical protein
MLHAIGNYEVTAFKGFAIEELEIDLPFHLVAKGEHSLVSLAPDQDHVDRLQKLRTDLGDFLAPMKPIRAVIPCGQCSCRGC